MANIRYHVFWQSVAALIWSIAWKLNSFVGRGSYRKQTQEGSLLVFGFAHLPVLVGEEDER